MFAAKYYLSTNFPTIVKNGNLGLKLPKISILSLVLIQSLVADCKYMYATKCSSFTIHILFYVIGVRFLEKIHITVKHVHTPEN